MRAVTCGALVAALVACGGADRAGESAVADVGTLAALPWDSVTARARGSVVTWRMWRGDPAINAYVDEWLAPRLREEFDITLEAVDGQGPEIVNQLVIEREAGRGRGSASLLWINGETFATLRAESLLAGPWSGAIPNAAYIDSASRIIARDFEQDPSGFESPWGTVQFALIYDTVRTPNPPRSFEELARWTVEHPGRVKLDKGVYRRDVPQDAHVCPRRRRGGLRGWFPRAAVFSGPCGRVLVAGFGEAQSLARG